MEFGRAPAYFARRALVEATGGTLHGLTVTGPVGEPVEAHYDFLGGECQTAVLERLRRPV